MAQRACEPRLVCVGRGVRLERDDGGKRQALCRWARVSPRPVADVPSATRGSACARGAAETHGGDPVRDAVLGAELVAQRVREAV